MSDVAVKPPTPAAPVWTCQFSEAGQPLTDLTAGSKFTMKCHGDIPVEWTKDPLKLAFAKEEENYTLAILEVKALESQDAELLVTGYKAGKHNPEYVRVLQGDKGFETAKPQWEIKTVLKKNEQPQPYPSFGPYSVSFPIWILIAGALTLAAVIWACVRFIRRTTQRRRMLEDLKRHATALSPLHQFYRDSRNLRRRLHNVKTADELKTLSEDLDREFRLYVLRQFQIPTLDWSNGAILRDLRKRHRKVYNHAADPLKKTLRELLKLRAQNNVLMKDLEQMHTMSLDTAEKLDSAGGGKS